MLRRALAALLGPLLRRILRFVPVPDPWERLDYAAPLLAFGTGARHDFDWYFDGASDVRVRSLDDIQHWLSTCTYTSDQTLFHEPDFWQHPNTFEQVRRGDCEDFALWAWRKLVELGYDADLVVGRCAPFDAAASRHAWVVFRHDGAEYLYDPVIRDPARAVQPLAAVRDAYIPEFGVGPDRKRFSFAGYLSSVRAEQQSRKERSTATATGTM